jgi:hypothetical protein
MQNGIPTKGIILTLLSAKWFEVLSSRVPALKHHFLHLGPPASSGLITEDEKKMLRGRSMTVRYDMEPGYSSYISVLICVILTAVSRSFPLKPSAGLPYNPSYMRHGRTNIIPADSAWLCDGQRLGRVSNFLVHQQRNNPVGH